MLEDIGGQLKIGQFNMQPIFEAAGSGHGVGKSALVAWLVLWAMSTFENCRGIVTANTETQLRTKTWAELAKWKALCITRSWFELTATALFHVEHTQTWRVDAVTWNITRPEGFAGLHNQGKRVLVLFDEASAIPDIIWDNAEGAMTDKDTEIIWCAFGNRTRADGKFHGCFAPGNRWRSRCVDSRNAKASNKEQLQYWIDQYGIDSDFVKMRVLGEAPRISDSAFISRDVVTAARRREVLDFQVQHYPLVFGVDVARFGTDKSVITSTRGNKQISLFKYRGVDTMTLAGIVVDMWRGTGSQSTICVDGAGVGGGVVDRLRMLNIPVIDVNVGTAATKPREFANLRAELGSALRDWLNGAAIIDDEEQAAELTSLQYGYNGQMQLLLEKKDDLRRRGLPSPDTFDALMLTRAVETARQTPRNTKVIAVQQRKVIW